MPLSRLYVKLHSAISLLSLALRPEMGETGSHAPSQANTTLKLCNTLKLICII